MMASGSITSTLKKHGLTEQYPRFFIGDNGAPLKIHKVDSPLEGDAGGWDGSLNTPLNGEKGMLAEGGMSTPYLVAFPGTIPGGQIYEHPVSALRRRRHRGGSCEGERESRRARRRGSHPASQWGTQDSAPRRADVALDGPKRHPRGQLETPARRRARIPLRSRHRPRRRSTT